jgi:hypothetical protein
VVKTVKGKYRVLSIEIPSSFDIEFEVTPEMLVSEEQHKITY